MRTLAIVLGLAFAAVVAVVLFGRRVVRRAIPRVTERPAP